MERSNLAHVFCCSAAVMPVDVGKLEEQLSFKKFVSTTLKTEFDTHSSNLPSVEINLFLLIKLMHVLIEAKLFCIVTKLFLGYNKHVKAGRFSADMSFQKLSPASVGQALLFLSSML
jgi:hypothetical protein